jgi:hypothetical protein
LPGHDLIAADSTQLWVFDQGTATVCRFSYPRLKRTCRLLPGSLDQRLRQYRDDRVTTLERAARIRVQAAPLVKDLVQVGPLIALLLPLPELPVALVDFTDGTVTPAFYTLDSLPNWARRATSFAWDGRRFVLLSDEGLGHIRVSKR